MLSIIRWAFLIRCAVSSMIWEDVFNDMGTHMKTTIEISDTLMKEARKLAAREHTTLRNLVELGLRRVLAEKRSGARFHLRKVSFKGEGLQPELRNASWERVRELAYEGHGA
jgi:Arc/MetJ family transcription regulator